MSTRLSAAEFFSVLQSTGLPARYSHFTSPQEAPFLVYRGNGQTTWAADNKAYWKENDFIVEYYYKDKDPATEEMIEAAFEDAALFYEKSEDIWIEDEGVFVIYYYI